MKNRKSLKAGIIQFDVKLGDIASNIDTASEGIEFLGSKNADMALLPEMWSCSFDNERLGDHAGETPAILEKLSRAAVGNNIIIAGSLPEASGGDIFNTLYVIDKDGSLAGSYRKVHRFSLTEENNYFSAGTRNVVCETSVGPVGLMICYDLRFPELCRSLALKGALVVIVPAQWPLVRVRHWNALLQARAIENQLFMVAANRCGDESDLKFGGHSQIVSPLGNVLAGTGPQPDTFCAELDFQELEEYRKTIPCLEERMPDAYRI
ncbi:carbon-nitrogen family hydrolase [Desulfobacterales bacterium HSG2]|nr:carbon-nitrogen family hydrolase [Desulfobacterales bacterium HSG2]